MTMMRRTINHRKFPANARRPGGALYATTLFLSLIVVSGGVSLVASQMTSRQLQANLRASDQSYYLARSGLEWTLAYVDSEPDWRTFMAKGGETEVDLGGVGKFTVSVVDADGAIADSESDAVGIRVTGEADRAIRGFELTAKPGPHPLLEYALVAWADIHFKNNFSIYGPIYGTLTTSSDQIPDTKDNAVFCAPSDGTIASWLKPQDDSVDKLSKPDVNLNAFTSIATKVPNRFFKNGVLENVNLTPTDAPDGNVNPNGIYYIDTELKDILLKNVHVKGTLIIKTGNDSVEFHEACVIEPNETGYPSLLVFGRTNATVDFAMAGTLSENPAGCTEVECLNGDCECMDVNEDGDFDDSFDPSVSGLVWIEAQTTSLRGSSWKFKGCLVGNDIWVDDGVLIDDDPGLSASPIFQFTDGKLHVQPGSVREVSP